MHNLWVFYYFFQKSLLAETYFLIAAMNLTTQGPQYTFLVSHREMWACKAPQGLQVIHELTTAQENGEQMERLEIKA